MVPAKEKPYLKLLVFVAAIAGTTWGFVELADEVTENETRTVDEAILLAMRSEADLADPIGPDWFEEMVRDISALGSLGVLLLVSLSVCGFLLLQRRWRYAGVVLLSTSTGVGVTFLLKDLFARPRPDLVPHISTVHTASFPSGHAMLASLVYLTLGALLAHVQRSRRVKSYTIGVALLFSVLVGLSRIYLGVHWPTDVLGGWMGGAAWATFWYLAVVHIPAAWLGKPESRTG